MERSGWKFAQAATGRYGTAGERSGRFSSIAPDWRLLVPGALLLPLRALEYLLALPAVTIGGVTLNAHILLVTSHGILCGNQPIQFATLSKDPRRRWTCRATPRRD